MAIEDYYSVLFVCSTTQNVDEYGDANTTYSAEREIMGYVGKPSSAQAHFAAQRGITIDGRLYAPVSAEVKPFDIIRDPASGQRWQVVSEPRDAAMRGHHVEADLLKWRGV